MTDREDEARREGWLEVVIEVMPLPPRVLTVSDWSFTIPLSARYARTYRTSPDGAEIYQHAPEV